MASTTAAASGALYSVPSEVVFRDWESQCDAALCSGSKAGPVLERRLLVTNTLLTTEPLIVTPPTTRRFRLRASVGADAVLTPLAPPKSSVVYIVEYVRPTESEGDFLWDNFQDRITIFSRGASLNVRLCAVRRGRTAPTSEFVPKWSALQAPGRPSDSLFEYIAGNDEFDADKTVTVEKVALLADVQDAPLDERREEEDLEERGRGRGRRRPDQDNEDDERASQVVLGRHPPSLRAAVGASEGKVGGSMDIYGQEDSVGGPRRRSPDTTQGPEVDSAPNSPQLMTVIHAPVAARAPIAVDSAEEARQIIQMLRSRRRSQPSNVEATAHQQQQYGNGTSSAGDGGDGGGTASNLDFEDFQALVMSTKVNSPPPRIPTPPTGGRGSPSRRHGGAGGARGGDGAPGSPSGVSEADFYHQLVEADKAKARSQPDSPSMATRGPARAPMTAARARCLYRDENDPSRRESKRLHDAVATQREKVLGGIGLSANPTESKVQNTQGQLGDDDNNDDQAFWQGEGGDDQTYEFRGNSDGLRGGSDGAAVSSRRQPPPTFDDGTDSEDEDAGGAPARTPRMEVTHDDKELDFYRTIMQSGAPSPLRGAASVTGGSSPSSPLPVFKSEPKLRAETGGPVGVSASTEMRKSRSTDADRAVAAMAHERTPAAAKQKQSRTPVVSGANTQRVSTGRPVVRGGGTTEASAAGRGKLLSQTTGAAAAQPTRAKAASQCSREGTGGFLGASAWDDSDSDDGNWFTDAPKDSLEDQDRGLSLTDGSDDDHGEDHLERLASKGINVTAISSTMPLKSKKRPSRQKQKRK